MFLVSSVLCAGVVSSFECAFLERPRWYKDTGTPDEAPSNSFAVSTSVSSVILQTSCDGDVFSHLLAIIVANLKAISCFTLVWSAFDFANYITCFVVVLLEF